MAIGGLFFVAAWTYAMNSREYEAASRLLRSSAVQQISGQVHWKVLTAFRISSVPGKRSSICFFAFGTKSSGFLNVHFLAGETASHIESVTFHGQQVQLPTEQSLK
jgi:hypothetical protein